MIPFLCASTGSFSVVSTLRTSCVPTLCICFCRDPVRMGSLLPSSVKA